MDEAGLVKKKSGLRDRVCCLESVDTSQMSARDKNLHEYQVGIATRLSNAIAGVLDPTEAEEALVKEVTRQFEDLTSDYLQQLQEVANRPFPSD